ncbi:hypothetical protein GARC_2422 [Paraglaciecola arctica BSs20135]|uniref:Uncharacterized protein n=1 Tax=Paraglaciecola arctica BSs20135 TaxID=493475 RepID=K6YRT9_9ALTE|nr:hypothetical protein GARC_2422 [Paraglaciecola arctica BSs20135]
MDVVNKIVPDDFVTEISARSRTVGTGSIKKGHLGDLY